MLANYGDTLKKTILLLNTHSLTVFVKLNFLNTDFNHYSDTKITSFPFDFQLTLERAQQRCTDVGTFFKILSYIQYFIKIKY